MLLNIILSTFVIGFISLLSVILIFGKDKPLSFLKALISLAAGSLLAIAFLDLLPEVLSENLAPSLVFGVTLGSILFFFILEKIFHWHHCQCDEHDCVCPPHKSNIIYTNLIGDAIHNLLDGFLVASAFMLSFQAGLIVTLGVILHEIPREISDFGVLLYAGLDKLKALFYNFLTAVLEIGGAVAFYFLGSQVGAVAPLMAAFAAGNFIYLASADLIPELHHETDPKKVISHTVWLLFGVILVYLLMKFVPH